MARSTVVAPCARSLWQSESCAADSALSCPVQHCSNGSQSLSLSTVVWCDPGRLTRAWCSQRQEQGFVSSTALQEQMLCRILIAAVLKTNTGPMVQPT